MPRRTRKGVPLAAAPLLVLLAASLACCSPPAADGDAEADADADLDADGGGDGDLEGDGGQDGGADGSADADGEPGRRERPCTTEVVYRPDRIVSEVLLAGEWDWASPQPMRFEGGAFRAERDLAPGIHCYKLVVDGEWTLDPGNPYRAYCEGVENSGLRVPDRSAPLLSLEGAPAPSGASFSARVLFHSGCGGPGPAEVSASRTHDFVETAVEASWEEGEWSLAIDLAGLPAGKHTVRVTARDEAGREAEPLLLPFWVEDEPFSWQDALVYMIMIDRFVNADGSNDPAPTGAAAPTGDWHGGDLAGVTRVIESGYFDELGVRALWLSPWNTGAEGAELASDGVHLVTGYHGYWPIEPRAVDPRLGTEDDLRALVAAAHGRGIRVLMDLVVNHVHEDHVYFREHPDWFNDGCICGVGGCDWTGDRLTCLFASYMPDLDWRNEAASEQAIADALWWLETFDLDGFRIDAVKHVDDLAIFNLATRVVETFETAGTDYYLDGETAMGWAGDRLEDNLREYQTIGRYIGPYGLDGQFDFVLYHAVVEGVFARSERGYMHLDYWTAQSQLHYPAGAVMTPFIGSHDSSRILTLCDYRGQDAEHPVSTAWHKWPEQGLPETPDEDEPYERLRLAFCWLLTVPGAPLLYTGDEHGEPGGADPDNRRMLRLEADLTAREAALLAEVRDLGSLRQAERALRRGGYESLGSTETLLAFARETEAGEALVVVVNSGSSPASHEVDLSGTALAGAGGLDDLLGWGASASVAGSRATLEVPARSCAVFGP